MAEEMTGIGSVLHGIIKKAEMNNPPEDGDYYDDEGFLVCGKCHTRRQVEIDVPDFSGGSQTPEKKTRMKVMVSCRCRAEKAREEEARRQQEAEMAAIQSLKKQSLMDERIRDVCEPEAKVVLHIYDLYESIKSLTIVAKTLNEKGVRSRTGKPWNPTTIRTILTNPFYAGTYRYNYRDETNTKRFSVKPETEWVMVEDHHPAIVTRERQNHIAAILQSKQRGWVGSGTTYQRKNTHIFAGLLRCGCCGSTMVSTVDRPRSDGWRPSVYICARRRRFNDCENKYVSDITLGPFVLNFIANLIRVSKSFGKSTSIETLQKKLLRGVMFEQVDHIERPGLEELYNHLRSGFESMPFESASVQSAESGAELQERELLLSEKRRLERAINRLRSLYLYSEESMAEKDYLIEHKALTDKLTDVDARLEEIEATAASSLSMSDEEFMAKASYFILTQQLQDKRFVDYEKFIRKIDPQIVKDFLNSVVSNFCIENGLTTSILFRNGLEVRFSYKSK